MMVRKRNSVCRDESIAVDELTDNGVGVVLADTVSEIESIAKDRDDIGPDTEAPVFARSVQLRAIGEIEVVGQGKSGMVEKPSEANVAGELISLVPNDWGCYSVT